MSSADIEISKETQKENERNEFGREHGGLKSRAGGETLHW